MKKQISLVEITMALAALVVLIGFVISANLSREQNISIPQVFSRNIEQPKTAEVGTASSMVQAPQEIYSPETKYAAVNSKPWSVNGQTPELYSPSQASAAVNDQVYSPVVAPSGWAEAARMAAVVNSKPWSVNGPSQELYSPSQASTAVNDKVYSPVIAPSGWAEAARMSTQR